MRFFKCVASSTLSGLGVVVHVSHCACGPGWCLASQLKQDTMYGFYLRSLTGSVREVTAVLGVGKVSSEPNNRWTSSSARSKV